MGWVCEGIFAFTIMDANARTGYNEVAFLVSMLESLDAFVGSTDGRSTTVESGQCRGGCV